MVCLIYAGHFRKYLKNKQRFVYINNKIIYIVGKLFSQNHHERDGLFSPDEIESKRVQSLWRLASVSSKHGDIDTE